MYATFSQSILAFLAAKPPIDTWSYWLADVDMESTDAGLTSTFDSDNNDAEVSE